MRIVYFKTLILTTLFTSMLLFAGCSDQRSFSFSSAAETGNTQPVEVDVLARKWISPLSEPIVDGEWEVVQYIPDVAVPSDDHLVMYMNNSNICGDYAYSLLICEGIEDEKPVSGYELKSVDLQTLEIKTICQSLSDLEFDSIWNDSYISEIDEKLKNGLAAIVSIDAHENGVTLFIVVGNGESKEHYYEIEVDPTGKVRKVSDHIKVIEEKFENYPGIPETICGKDGSILWIDYSGKEISLTDESGKTVCVVDDKTVFTGLRCMGKNPEGTPIFYVNKINGTSEIFYIDNKGKHSIFNDKMNSGLYVIDKNGRMLILSGSKLFSWDVLTGKYDFCYDFIGLDAYTCVGLTYNSNGEILACFQSGEDEFIYRLSDTEHPQKQELVLLQVIDDEYVKSCAADYSRSHPDIKVNVETLDSNDEFAVNKLLVDIKKGIGPDIIWINRRGLNTLKNAGVLSPLDDYVSADLKDNIFEGALQVGEYDSQLYGMPCEASLGVNLVSNVDWKEETWSIEEALDAYSKSGGDNGKRFIALYWNMSPQDLFDQICTNNLEYSGFIDWDNNKCSFMTESFYDLLRFCKNHCDKEYEASVFRYADEEIEELKNGKALIINAGGTIKEYSYKRKALTDDFHVVGDPTESKIKSHVACYRVAALSAMSDKKEEAAEFINALVSEEYQVKYTLNWVRRDVMTKHIKNAWELNLNSDCHDEYDNCPAFVINRRTRIPLSGREDGTSYLDEYIALMDAGVPESIEYELQDILTEEVSAYFSGEKDEYEVADIIQNRIQNYLDER